MSINSDKPVLFCKGGGCTAKLGPAVLERVLSRLPKGEKDPNLLVGYDSHDDACIYKITEDTAIVQTLDFFPPMLEDPYLFGQVAATNALSDIYAMGGEVKTALNIVCFPEKMDLNILGEILRGGQEKVMEAGGTLAGGHSIADDSVKYGLSVTGVVHPDHVLTNDGCRVGDVLILTKPLGVGIVMTASRMGEAREESFEEAVASMTTLNRYAAERLHDFTVHACTDITGFSLLGHLTEMTHGAYTAIIEKDQVPVINGALDYADDFLLTAAAQRNRNFVGDKVEFVDTSFAMQEVLFDPQTSGGLLIAVEESEAQRLFDALEELPQKSAIIGRITEKQTREIIVL